MSLSESDLVVGSAANAKEEAEKLKRFSSTKLQKLLKKRFLAFSLGTHSLRIGNEIDSLFLVVNLLCFLTYLWI